MKAHKDSALCVSAQTAERRRRARATCTHAGVKAAWPWGTQWLGQWSNEGWWWGTLWDHGPLLGSKAHCAAKSGAWAAYDQGGHPQGGPSVTEFTTYRPSTQLELIELSKQFWAKQGEPLAACFLCLWDRGLDQAPGGFWGSLLRELEGWHARHHLEVWRPWRSYTDASMSRFSGSGSWQK